MTRTTRRAARAAVVLAVLGSSFRASATESSPAGASQPPLMAPDARVRGSSQRLVAAIRDAVAGSRTFRNLVDQIGRTDGIIYVMEGQCQPGVRACLLLSMTVMGANRVLWIRIDPRKVDRDLMGSIGHELQHALEVLSHPSIRTGSAMTLLYNKEGSKEGGHLETDAAIRAGNAVRAELRGIEAAELSAETAVAAGRETTIVVQVNDYEEISPADLTEAESVATHIYEAIGVRVIWVHAEVPFADPRGVRVHVRLLSREMANRMIAKEKIKDDVLGEAIASTYGAYVFVDRISPVVFQFAQPYTRVLGLVIAHEIGHILLPGQRHSESGIMSADVNLWSRKLVYFTLEQGTAIRSLLRRLATQ